VAYVPCTCEYFHAINTDCCLCVISWLCVDVLSVFSKGSRIALGWLWLSLGYYALFYRHCLTKYPSLGLCATLWSLLSLGTLQQEDRAAVSWEVTRHPSARVMVGLRLLVHPGRKAVLPDELLWLPASLLGPLPWVFIIKSKEQKLKHDTPESTFPQIPVLCLDRSHAPHNDILVNSGPYTCGDPTGFNGAQKSLSPNDITAIIQS
jgi:hypothetical protein